MASYLRHNWKKLLSACLAVCLLSVALLFVMDTAVHAEEDSGSDKTVEQLEKDKQELNAKIKENQKQLDSVAAKKKQEQSKQKNLEGQIGTVQQQISLYLNKIDIVTEQIAQKELEIDQKLAEVAVSEEQFAKRVRAMYINNTSNSTLNTILSAKSFSDMLNQTEIVKRVSATDQEMIDELTKQREELEKLKADMEAQKEDLSATKNSYDKQSSQLNTLLGQSESTESELLQLEKQYMDNKKKQQKEMQALEAEIQRVIAENAGADAYGDGILKWPLPNNKVISSPFGWRVLFGQRDYHTGIDIPAPKGTSIQSADAGKVILVQKSNSGYGWHLVVDHGGGYVTLYAHSSAIYVNSGDMVQKGQSIAGVGTTGNSTGNHLHFEVRVNNVQQNPINYVKQPR